MNYRSEIDGLRALAILPVILFHAGYEILSGGFVGVDVFFVISGYLITSILLNEIQAGTFSFAKFYERRARRILPVLFLVVVVTMIISAFILLPQQLISLAKSAIAIPLFSSNFFFWSERGYFGEATDLKPLIHTWSLAVEEQFYILFPIVLLVLSKFRDRFLIGLLMLAFGLSLGASYYVTLLHFDTAFFFPFTRAWELLIGAFCAIAMKRKLFALPQLWSEAASVVGLAMIFGSYVCFDSHTLFPYVTALIPTLGTAVFILAAANAPVARKLVGSKPLVAIGLISYSLYLWHQPVFALARATNVFEHYFSVLVVLVFGLSVLSYFFVEQPFRNRAKNSTRRIWGLSAAGSLGLIALGLIFVLSNGFIGRFDKSEQRLMEQFANYSGYNQARFDSLIHAPFTDPESRKVVLIGDSFAKDFLNVVEESDLFAGYEFSTKQINSECGNLYLQDYEAVQKNIPRSRQERCRFLRRYDSDAFIELLTQADEIWLVSDWKEWVIDFLPGSIDRLEADFGKPVSVVGLKNFGPVDQKKALDIPASKRPEFTQAVFAEVVELSDHLGSTLAGYEGYYSVLDDMCAGSSQKCRVFTSDGLVVSADGRHLTKEGAIEMGKRIRPELLRLRSMGGN
ncbi:acyltransferase [Thalassospira sp. MA62]|nr:acyltransferase [Thalassospira sp. MA62]